MFTSEVEVSLLEKSIPVCSLFKSLKRVSFGTSGSCWQENNPIKPASKPDAKGEFSYYIDCSSKDTSSKQASLILKNKDVPEFFNFLNSIKETYSKWSLTAKENKVTELDKNIEYKKLTYSAAFTYGKWNFDYSVNLTTRFKIINGKYQITVPILK